MVSLESGYWCVLAARTVLALRLSFLQQQMVPAFDCLPVYQGLPKHNRGYEILIFVYPRLSFKVDTCHSRFAKGSIEICDTRLNKG